jgi:hypothetical protein
MPKIELYKCQKEQCNNQSSVKLNLSLQRTLAVAHAVDVRRYNKVEITY